MLFTYLEQGCECLNDSLEDHESTFIRRVRRSPGLKEPDFYTHIEKGKLPKNEEDCTEVCGLNALSFEIWNSESQADLKLKYNITAEFSPKLSKNLCVIKFKPKSGLVKFTPNQVGGYNKYHYDFYKNESFSVDDLELVEMIKI